MNRIGSWAGSICLLILVTACAGQDMGKPYASANASFPLECPTGAVMRAKDSGGKFKFLRAAVEQDGLEVLRIIQTYGQLPKENGAALLAGVDKGTVQPHHGPGHALWYFPANAGMPSKLPWVNSKGECKGSSPRAVSDTFHGWVYFKVPHAMRLNVPTELLLRSEVCVRGHNFQTVHDVRQTQGTFKDVPGVICGYPGRMQEAFAAGYDGMYYVFVTSSNAPPTMRGSP